MAKVKEIIKIMEEIAPPFLKESYDNVGLMVGDRESVVNRVLLSLDCTKAVIEEGTYLGVEMIISHHPLIFRKASSVTEDTLQGKKIRSLIKNDISLYSSHTNWDSAQDGINDEFARILGFEESRIIERNSFDAKAGIGRIVTLKEEKKLNEIIDEVKEIFNLETIRFAGDLDSNIRTIALINGSGQDFFEIAYKEGADLVITGDTTYHYVSDYSEMGLNIIDIGHFNSEWPLVISLSKKLKKRMEEIGVELFISNKIKDPYKYI